ncbi:hypothetical protein JIW05_12645 [Vibrio anguillarum]|nr:hypothetical protein [Vibrio anguillarum]
MSVVDSLADGQVVAIDGKTLRSSYNRDNRASTIHMINAYISSKNWGFIKAEAVEKTTRY